ncbi:MAG: hypothetical protein Kow0092_12620 [Deferrisomatales bacterium]
MPKTVLGVRLEGEEALAVLLKGGWKGVTVDRVIRLPVPPPVAEDEELPPSPPALPHADAVVAAVPADAVFPRIVELPFSDRTKVEQAAPLEAEESLALPLEDLVCHVHVLEKASRRTRVLLVAAAQERISSLLDRLGRLSVAPHAVDVEALALATVAAPFVPAGETAVVVDLGRRLCQAVLVRPEGPLGIYALSGLVQDPDLVDEVATCLLSWAEGGQAPGRVYLSGSEALAQDLDRWRSALGVAVEVLPLPSEGVTVHSDGGVAWPAWAVPLGLALREGYAKPASEINLLQGPFAPQRETGPWKQAGVRVAVFAAVLAALWGAGVWTEAQYKEDQYQALRDAVRRIFRQTLPEVTNVVSELDQMRAKVDELEARAASLGSLVDREVSPLRLLREISARIPKELEVEFREVSIDEGRVRLEGITTSFDATEKVRAELATYERFRKIPPPEAKTSTEPGKVIFRLSIDLRLEG